MSKNLVVQESLESEGRDNAPQGPVGNGPPAFVNNSCELWAYRLLCAAYSLRLGRCMIQPNKIERRKRPNTDCDSA